MDGGREASEAGAARRLEARLQRVVDVWVERVRERIPAAREGARPVLVDSLHLFLEQLADALDPASSRRDGTEGSTVPREHGSQRVRLTGYRLGDLIAEYQLLRQVLVEVLEEDGPLPGPSRDVVDRTIDRAILDAASAYALAQASARERFVAQVAHDLRSPLSAIHSAATLLVRRPDAPEAPRWAVRILAQVERADGMLRDLLDASRVDAGRPLRADLSECDLVELVRQAIDHQSTVHGDRFVLRAPDRPVTGHWAGELVVRAIENLLSNAVKYGAAGAPVTAAVVTEGSMVRVGVHNAGSYLDAGEREAVFQAFHRADAAEHGGARGWGLGLTIVRGIVEAHGGTLSLESDRERGTTFHLHLPVDARPFQEAAARGP